MFSNIVGRAGTRSSTLLVWGVALSGSLGCPQTYNLLFQFPRAGITGTFHHTLCHFSSVLTTSPFPEQYSLKALLVNHQVVCSPLAYNTRERFILVVLNWSYFLGGKMRDRCQKVSASKPLGLYLSNWDTEEALRPDTAKVHSAFPMGDVLTFLKCLSCLFLWSCPLEVKLVRRFYKNTAVK